MRAPDGTIAGFDSPGSNNTFDDHALSISRNGAITGSYEHRQIAFHGFVRETGGTIKSFDPPGSISAVAVSINADGAVTGYYLDNSNATHGFVRTR